MTGLLDPLVEKAAGMAGAFVPLGETFLAIAIVIALMLAVYDWWLGSVSGAISRAVRGGIALVVPLALLLNWTPIMKTTANFFTSELTAPITRAAGFSDGGSAVQSAVRRLNDALFPKPAPGGAPGAAGSQAGPSTFDYVTGRASIGREIINKLTQAAFDVVLFFVSLLVGFALILALYGPLLTLQLGAIFGPLLVAWLPWQPMAHLFHNWLRFMLASGVALLVGITLATLAAGVLGDFASQMASIGTDPTMSLADELLARVGAFMTSVSVIVFVAYFLMQTESIASSLIGGAGSGSGAVASGILGGMRRMRGELVRKTGGAKAAMPVQPPKP